MDLLRHLAYFTTVAETRHFGHAAQDLGMTQPPLSQGIQRLERRIGVRLFDRDSRGVRLTDEGARLLPLARDLVERGESFVAAAQASVAPTRVRLGVTSELEHLASRLLSGLTGAGVAVSPVLAGSVELVDRVLDGELDLAVVRHPGVADGLTAGGVIRIPTRLESRGGEVIAESQLPVATTPRHHQPPAHDQLVDELRRAGHSGATVEAADAGQRSALVVAGLAVRLVPDPGATDALPPLRLRVVRPQGRSRRSEVDHDRLVGLIEELL